MMILFGLGTSIVMPVDLAHGNLMRVAEVHNQVLALLSDTVANAVERSAPS